MEYDGPEAVDRSIGGHRPDHHSRLRHSVSASSETQLTRSLAITARLWADDPFVSSLQWANETRSIGTPSVIVAITWMGLSAATDGAITLVLIYNFRSQSAQSPKLASRLVSLTLETSPLDPHLRRNDVYHLSRFSSRS